MGEAKTGKWENVVVDFILPKFPTETLEDDFSFRVSNGHLSCVRRTAVGIMLFVWPPTNTHTQTHTYINMHKQTYINTHTLYVT